MAYTKFYPDGMKNLPDETTPYSAEFGTHIEDGIGEIDTILTNLANIMYPINRVVEFQDNLDHSNYLGFNWVLTHLDRFPKGRNETTTAGTQGGEKTHTLIQSELPSEVVVSANVGNNTISGVPKGPVTSWVLSGLRDVGMDNSQPHNNEPQFEITAYWKRTA